MSKKYLIIVGVGAVLLIAGSLAGYELIKGFGVYFLAWSLFGDILSGVTWQKHTTINTKQTDIYNRSGGEEATNE